MDKYQGKNLDRYQEEIRRAAAKGVKDLNLNGSTTPTLTNNLGSHFGRTFPKAVSSTSYLTTNGNDSFKTQNSAVASNVSNTLRSSISVSAAAAKFESLQRLNQVNISNGNGTKTSTSTLAQNDNIEKDATGRRRSTGPIIATMIPITRETSSTSYSNKFISKSNSASSVLQHLTNGNQIIRPASTISTVSNSGVIADFAFGSGENVQNNGNDTTSNILHRVSPLTLNNTKNYVDQNPQVHQLTARFNHVVNTNTLNLNQCPTQNALNTNSSAQSSRQSSTSPFPPARVSPCPSLTSSTITNPQTHNLSNGVSIINHNIREQAHTKVCSIHI
jgi:hypothetical protein